MRSTHCKYLSKAKVKQRWWSNSTYRLRYWNFAFAENTYGSYATLQQYLPLTVCAAECETAEERSNDEAHTSQVPERREGKAKVMRKQYLLFTVLKRYNSTIGTFTRKIQNYNSIYRLRYWNTCLFNYSTARFVDFSCNTTYRLRYAPQSVRQQRRRATMRSAHLLPEQSEGKTKVMRK